MSDNKLACATEQRELPSQLNVLESVVSNLESEITDLTDLLSTVTIPDGEVPESPKATPERYTERARQLQVLSFRLDAIVDVVRRLNNKVQV